MNTAKAFILISATIIALGAGSVVRAYSGGTGEPNNPYQIATKADLLALGANSGDYGKCFIMTADVNMAGQVFTRAIIAPASYFTGTFDGNGHKITNIAINGGTNSYLGLFGLTKTTASVKNLGVENCSVIGSGNLSGNGSLSVGGLVGQSYGSITNCYSTGVINGGTHSYSIGGLMGGGSGTITNCYSTASVSGSFSVGGLVGEHDGGIISNCYSTGAVSLLPVYSIGCSMVGGLVGLNDGGIISYCYSTGSVTGGSTSEDVGGLVGKVNAGIFNNCYATGSVSGSSYVGGLVGYISSGSISHCYSTKAVSGSSNVGGLVGYNQGGISDPINRCMNVAGSFWDTQVSGKTTSSGGTGLPTAQMQTFSTFISAGWDFTNETANGTCNFWMMPQGGGYPVLAIFNGYIPQEPQGNGTPQNPYIITDANDLGTIWYRPNANFILAKNVNLLGISWSAAIVPAFSGVFNGNGFGINNLSITGGEYLGLFGIIEAGGSVNNLGIGNCVVSGSSNSYAVGVLAGDNSGSVSSCYSTGTVTGSWYFESSSQNVGGLVGGNAHSGSISNCYSTCIVSGSPGLGLDSQDFGGLAGYNNSSTSNYVSGGVSFYSGSGQAIQNIGGLSGYNNGSIGNCFSVGAVSGSDFGLGSQNVGGLVGLNSGGSVSGSFWDLQASGQPTSSGGTGETTTQMKTLSTFTSAGWDFTNGTTAGTWRMCADGVSYPLLQWQFSADDFVCPDGDGFEDLGYFVQQWLQNDCSLSNNYCGRADMNMSGSVEFKDFALFASEWLNGQ